MKINYNDPVTPQSVGGISKLEHFALTLMAAKITNKDLDNGAIPSNHLKLTAQHSVREATALIDALNEYNALVAKTEEYNKNPHYYEPDGGAKAALGIMRQADNELAEERRARQQEEQTI